MAGEREIEMSVRDSSSLDDLLTRMIERWGEELRLKLVDPETSELLPYIRLMVNGRDIGFLNKMETILKDGDEILILPPVGGG